LRNEGDAVPQEFIPKLIALHRKGLFPFERLERHYEFRQINRAIADARCGRTVKPVIHMTEAPAQ
jgi:aryl-alcohol dehydrogenase